MILDIEFEEIAQELPVDMGEVHNISDGGFERGYAAGYAEGETKGNTVADSIIERTITEFINHRVTKIGGYAFARHSGLIKIDIPNVETIEQYGFNYCTGLTEIELPKVKTIANQAFNSCGKLTKVDAPMLEKIEGYSFTGSKLTTLIIRQNSKVCTLASVSALRSTPIESGTGFIYVSTDLVESYKAAANWATFASQIRAIEDYPEITGGGSN